MFYRNILDQSLIFWSYKQRIDISMAIQAKTHIRRCHVCGEMNEVEGKTVDRCTSCGKHLAPFYFFDESQMDGFGDLTNELELKSEQKDLGKKLEPFYHPIWGLTVLW